MPAEERPALEHAKAVPADVVVRLSVRGIRDHLLERNERVTAAADHLGQFSDLLRVDRDNLPVETRP